MFRKLAVNGSWNLRYIPRNLMIRQSPGVRWASTIDSGVLENAEFASAKPFESIPHLRILPIWGTGWQFLPIIGGYDLRKPDEVMRKKRKKLGDIFRDKFGPYDFVISFNGDDVQTMTKNEGPYPSRGELVALKAYRESRKDFYKSTGVMILQGKEWYELRSRVQKHMMKPKAIQAYLNPMQDVARDFITRLRRIKDANSEVPEFLQELYKWSLESIGFVGLDIRLGCFEPNLSPESDGMKMIDSVQTLFQCIYKLELFTGSLLLWKWFPTPTWRKFAKAGDTFTAIAYKYINQRLEDLKKVSENEDKDLTLLQCMLMEKGLEVSGAMVTVADMMFAGIETTSHTAGFFLYHMARNPDKQKLVHKEIISLLPNKEDRLTKNILNELKYLKACIKESMRLNPVVGGFLRKLENDVVMSGYRVPAGSLFAAPTQMMGRDEKYFKDAEKYLPERWMNKDEDFHPFAFLPFGFGVRSCVGRRLAELEIICLLTEIMRNFEVQYHHEDIGMFAKFVNTPDRPLRFNFIDK